MARAEAISSTPPEAPRRWPSWLLVLEIWSRGSVVLEDALHGDCLGQVAQRRAGTVGVDVINGVGSDAGV